jgi:hypothetical protein
MIPMIRALLYYCKYAEGDMTLPYLALNMQLPADVLDLLADCGVNWGAVSRKHGSILHYALSHECDIDTVRYCRLFEIAAFFAKSQLIMDMF